MDRKIYLPGEIKDEYMGYGVLIVTRDQSGTLSFLNTRFNRDSFIGRTGKYATDSLLRVYLGINEKGFSEAGFGEEGTSEDGTRKSPSVEDLDRKLVMPRFLEMRETPSAV